MKPYRKYLKRRNAYMSMLNLLSNLIFKEIQGGENYNTYINEFLHITNKCIDANDRKLYVSKYNMNIICRTFIKAFFHVYDTHVISFDKAQTVISDNLVLMIDRHHNNLTQESFYNEVIAKITKRVRYMNKKMSIETEKDLKKLIKDVFDIDTFYIIVDMISDILYYYNY